MTKKGNQQSRNAASNYIVHMQKIPIWSNVEVKSAGKQKQIYNQGIQQSKKSAQN